ncbi:MAG TPA: AI-2E family transporter [Steroidobacteraceae bacterium]|jgi:predicted PurR-regulated permease PerM|nr:AI-2E family transporter [Steroidobacteraceae bacterium]
MQPIGPGTSGGGPKSGPARLPGAQADSRGRQIALAAVSTVALVAVVWFLSWAKGLLIPLSFALLLAACLSPAVNALARIHVPRSIGAALVLLMLSALIGTAASRTRGDLMQMLDQMPPAARYVRHEVRRTLDDPSSIAHRLALLANLPENAVAPPTQQRPAPAPPVPSVVTTGTQVASLTGELAAVLFLVYLLLASGGRLQRRLSDHPLLSAPLRLGLQSTYAQFEHALHRYLGALVLSNALLGVCIWGAFYLLRVHYAGAWGIAAALAHFVPYLGPALFALGTALFASVQFHSLAQGLLVAGVTLALSTLIGVGLQTWLFGRSVRMNTVAVFVSLLFWGWLWGLPGLLLGTPITFGLKVVCQNVRQLQWIGLLLEDHRREPRSAVRESLLHVVQRTDSTDGSPR